MQALTDEERKNLCAELRNPHERDFLTFDTAAEEIERLAAEVKKLKDELDLVRQDEERFIYD